MNIILKKPKIINDTVESMNNRKNDIKAIEKIYKKTIEDLITDHNNEIKDLCNKHERELISVATNNQSKAKEDKLKFIKHAKEIINNKNIYIKQLKQQYKDIVQENNKIRYALELMTPYKNRLDNTLRRLEQYSLKIQTESIDINNHIVRSKDELEMETYKLKKVQKDIDKLLGDTN